MCFLFLATLAFGYYDQVKSKVVISPDKFVAHPLYQEFTLHITNNNSYPIYDYAVVIMVSEGDLNVNTDLKFEPFETLDQPHSEIPFKAFGLGGISDKYGLSYMELHFPELAANSSKKYLVKINAAKYKDASTVLFNIGNYSKQPNPMYKMPLYRGKDGTMPKKLLLPRSMKKSK